MKRSVLIVGNFLPDVGGGRAVVEDLALKLVERGWTVLTTSRRQARPLRLLDMMATAWTRRRAYSVAQMAVFSGQAFLWAEAVCWTLRRAGKPYVLNLQGGKLPRFTGRWPGRVRRLLQRAAGVTAPSGYLRHELRLSREDIRLIPNAIELVRYPFRLRTQPAPRLAWLRAFGQTYNAPLAPQVVARLTSEFPETHLTMVGPDKRDGSRERTLRTAESLGVADRLETPGGVLRSEVPQRLTQSDVFLNTTNAECFGISTIEAMACGLCVVSTNVGGVPYLLEHEGDALLVPPNDADAMAAAVRRILTEPGLAARLSENARRKAEQFDWSIVLPQWEELLLEVAEKCRA